MTEPIVAFLPCRSGSLRVVQKNTRPFAGIDGGLARIKLVQLLACHDIDRIVVSTDDERVADIATETARERGREVEVIERPAHLATSETSTDELIQYVPTIINEGSILWVHVTSPFVYSEIYSRAIRVYLESVEKSDVDSLTSVTKIQTFIWNDNGPVNYDRGKEKWPRTQTLPEWYEVNSAFFIADISTYTEKEDRIGEHPYLFELEGVECIDIDWQKDFSLAEKIALASRELLGNV